MDCAPLINLFSGWTGPEQKTLFLESFNAFLSPRKEETLLRVSEGQCLNIYGGGARQTRIMIDSHISSLTQS